MTSSALIPALPDLDQLTTVRAIRLEDLVDRNSLKEVIKSFAQLFGISVRIYSADGEMLADAVETQLICKHINESVEGRTACGSVVASIKRAKPDPDQEGQLSQGCFCGACYNVVALSYDGRVVGKIILGPYLPAELREVPPSLLSTVPALDRSRVKDLLPRMPRARAETIGSITDHMRSVLDLILFSGHRVLLTSQMHLASVHESYREAQERSARLQEAYDKLKELDRLKSNFIATVSHELRTPLTSIIGYSEMLDEGIAGPLQPEQTEFVKTIREKGEQLLSLIMSLLDLSKLESGTLSLAKVEVNLHEVLKQVISVLTPTARKKGVRLVLGRAEELPTLHGDPARLQQAFLNLAENAVKFTPADGEVRLSARAATDQDPDDSSSIGYALLSPARTVIEASVSDTGIGIPEAEREKVFDPFYQVDSSSTREYGGTGLGLAIVKRLIEAHGGRIRVESNPPRGTSFVVTLPVQA